MLRGPQDRCPSAAAGAAMTRQIPTTIDAADADVPLLGERLGLFVLIVLGEGLVQIIDARQRGRVGPAPGGHRSRRVRAGLRALGPRPCGTGTPASRCSPSAACRARLSWSAHLVATLALATVVAVLGGLVAEPGEELTDHVRWLVLAAYAGYALLAVGVHSSAATACVRPASGCRSLVAAAVVAARARDRGRGRRSGRWPPGCSSRSSLTGGPPPLTVR